MSQRFQGPSFMGPMRDMPRAMYSSWGGQVTGRNVDGADFPRILEVEVA